MTDRRNELDKHLGLSENDSRYASYRERALKDHVGLALASENYAAAQVYALLLVVEGLEAQTTDVQVVNTEAIGIAIASSLEGDLRRIAEAMG